MSGRRSRRSRSLGERSRAIGPGQRRRPDFLRLLRPDWCMALKELELLWQETQTKSRNSRKQPHDLGHRDCCTIW